MLIKYSATCSFSRSQDGGAGEFTSRARQLRTGIYIYLLITSIQTERAFQKQRGVFLNAKVGVAGKKKKKEQRFVRNVGLGFKTPREVSK